MILLALYGLALALSGLYLYRLVGLATLARLDTAPPARPVAGGDLPVVAVHLPLRNERHVVKRLLDAVCGFDYPRDRLHIQVLDDSDDDTSDLIAECVGDWQAQGVTIEHLQRPSNIGYKAGNLAYGLERTAGDYIAIFDADFIPEKGWLRRALAHFNQPDSANIGLVQTAWGHLNRDHSALTYAQDLTVSQYSLSQAVRGRLGLWSSFYGSAGLWRRRCIEAVGGWSAATLTEDIDLAYRAQLAGWRLSYEPSILAQAELPTSIYAYKRQQFRWAKGNMQVMRQLWPDLLTKPISFWSRLDAVLFATWPLSHLLFVLILILRLCLFVWGHPLVIVLDVLCTLGILGMFTPVLIAALQGERYFPLHFLLGTGISLNDGAAMLAGLFGPPGGAFHITPKGSDGSDTGHLLFDWSVVGELVLFGVSIVGLVLSIQQAQWWTVSLFVINALGFGWVGAMSLRETLGSLRHK